MSRFCRAAALALAAGAGLLRTGVAQRPGQEPGDWDATHVQMSREGLNELLQRLDQAAQSSAYSSGVRAHAMLEAAAVRDRLKTGDFQVGDRILLRVEGEQELSDTFTVGSDRALALPVVGSVSLEGVLHSELETYLKGAIGKFVRDPIVHARSLIRVAILGEVNHPGYYTLSTQTLVTDALMFAGGPTHEAKLKGLRILRGDERVWEGAALEQAMTAGRTFDQLSLVAGDRIEVPKNGSFLNYNTVTVLSLLIGLPSAIFGLTRLF